MAKRVHHPGIVLKLEFLIPNSIHQKALAEATGYSPSELSLFCNGRRRLNVRLAFLLSRALGTTPAYWLQLQEAHDVANGAPGEDELAMVKPLRVWSDT